MENLVARRSVVKSCLFGVLAILSGVCICSVTSTIKNSSETETDYSTSVTNLQLLARHEQKIIEAISKYSDALEEKLRRIKSHFQKLVVVLRIACEQLYLKLKHIHAWSIEPNHEQEQDFNSSDWYSNVLKCGDLLDDIPSGVTDSEGKELNSKRAIPNCFNPLKAFQVIRRMTFELNEIEMEIEQNDNSEFLEAFSSLIHKLPVPSAKDRLESLFAVLNLVTTYGLRANDVSIGKLLKVNTKSGLSGTNCFELGYYALKNQMYSVAVDFFEQARLLGGNDLDKSDAYRSKFASLMDQRLNSAIKEHDDNFKNGMEGANYGHFFSKPIYNSTSPAFKNRRISNSRLSYAGEGMVGNQHGREMFNNFKNLCREQRSQPLFETLHEAKCFLHLKTHPFYLFPLKVEVLHKDPLIMQIHDVVTKNQSGILKNGARPTLARSRTVGNAVNKNSTEGDDTLTFQRSSLNSWLVDVGVRNQYSFVNDIVARITGMSTAARMSSETLQVANYAIGAHYTPHVDAFADHLLHLDPEERIAGDRLATFMIYLNSPGQGGATAFPLLGVVAKPIEGSALFWFNLHSNGTINERTVHGGCPILYGNKWVANKWIRAHNQMFSFRCGKQGAKDINYFYNKYF